MSDTIVLQPRLDLPAAEPLAQAMRKRLGSDITVDASQVTHLGALCLQVLVSGARSVSRAGHRFQLVNAPDRVLDQLAVMGFSPDDLGGTGA